MTGVNEIRSAFLNYFAREGHEIVPSSPLVPRNDPTLMFTNAGMVQFKNVFTGLEKRPYLRAVSAQKCVRAGGKHNDLDNVGYTARHLTFFEMMGNFSFGDYFKEGAINYAWQLVTEGFGLDPGQLWVTVHEDDDEAAAIWLDGVGLPADRLQRLGEDNIWAMGDVGPCGYDSEIFFDKGEAYGAPGGPASGGEDRFVEIWNLVFMQFEREFGGAMTELPKKNIDTGAGFERILSILNGGESVFATDLFAPLLETASRAIDAKYG